jgi:hypothetical protein
MKDLQKMTIEVDRRVEYKGEETIYSDLRIWIRMEAPEGSPGLRWISFLMIGDEGLSLFAGRSGALSDGYHQLIPFGELWTFYDTNRLLEGESAGSAEVPYRRVTVPRRVQRIILDDIRDAIDRYDDLDHDGRHPVRLDYSDKLAKWGEHYGQGKGEVVIEGPEKEIEALKGEKTFDRSWNAIDAIARNTTYSKNEKGTIKIYRESPTAFFWSVPGSLHGGLINHGNEDAPDWSVHT